MRVSASRLRATAVIVLAGGTLAMTAGCARIRDHKGYVVDTTLTDTVQPGIDNRDSVAKPLGRPSFEGEFDGDRSWYYGSRDTRQFAFGNPKPVSQTILTVRFDAAGNVVAVDRAGLEKVAKISPEGGKTPTLGRNRGFFSELFGNIGQVGGAGGGGAAGGTTDNPN
ncbi:outer membrane protein assembly factor BamE [Sphingomonas solaris]|uniref:Outer membrane protein assembly factor BamE n=1 Tax=Alterirhizorhabdus solaris TaxID=2529389 RepID=A0A558R2T2_9SPHN|nr:outer membrane protein assembly factor BamE [Sphingomonas solaris]TVV73691.1 outer membrane protein assembly factor BamE [Sphingomonas solaris]